MNLSSVFAPLLVASTVAFAPIQPKHSPASALYAAVNGADTSPKKVLVLGGDGFCGWPTSLYLSDQGHDVVIVDNLSRRNIDIELGCDSLTPITSPEVRRGAHEIYLLSHLCVNSLLQSTNHLLCRSVAKPGKK